MEKHKCFINVSLILSGFSINSILFSLVGLWLHPNQPAIAIILELETLISFLLIATEGRLAPIVVLAMVLCI